MQNHPSAQGATHESGVWVAGEKKVNEVKTYDLQPLGHGGGTSDATML